LDCLLFEALTCFDTLMSGGQVHALHAILRNTNGQSGWG